MAVDLKSRVALVLGLFLGLLPMVASADVRSPSNATTITATGNITTATTTQVLAASSNLQYIFWLGVETSGSNSTDTFQFEYSPVAGCVSSITAFVPFGQAVAPSANMFTAQYGGGGGNLGNSSAGIFPASAPFVLPAGYYLCVVTAGTTIALYGIAVSSQLNY